MTPTRHHRHPQQITLAGVVPVVIALSLGSGVATAAPGTGGQPGITAPAPSEQPGITGPAPSAPTPEPVYVEPSYEEPVETWVPVPVEYQEPAQPIENYDYEQNEYVAPEEPVYVEPIDYSQLHAPVPVEVPTAPKLAPRNTLRVGDFHMAQPNWISDETTAKTNGQTAVIEAQVTDFWRSTGVETDAAERLAASQVTAGVAGGLAGAAAAGVPAAAVGGTIGGLVGGTIGGTSAAFLAAPVVTPAGAIPAGVVGTAAGAGIGVGVGAAAAGIPAAAAGAAVGATAGVVGATAYGTGEGGEPVELEVPDIDQAAITAQTEEAVQSWQEEPAGAAVVTEVQNVIKQAPVVEQQVREDVSALPGGQEAVAAADQAVADFQAATEVPGLPLGMVADAIGAGIAPK